MFARASAFNSDLSAWNVDNVSDMSSMFTGASAFSSDLSAWNVSNVIDMAGMFRNAHSFNQDISLTLSTFQVLILLLKKQAE